MRTCSALLLILGLTASGQDLSALRGLPPGKSIEVTTTGGDTVRGRIAEVDAAGQISFRDRRRIQIAEVRQVTTERRNRLRAAGWGALAGFGVGFVIGATSAGYITDRNSPPATVRMETGAGLGLFGAGVGALIGALSATARDEVVYRSDK